MFFFLSFETVDHLLIIMAGYVTVTQRTTNIRVCTYSTHIQYMISS
jgi:hypothetical protein